MALRLPRLQRRRARADPVRRATPTGSTSTPRSSSSCTRPGSAIVEVPIPTYYGDEICYVNGMQYAKDVTRHVLALPAPQDGLRRRASRVRERRRTSSRRATDSSHGRLLAAGCASAPAQPGPRPRLLRRPARRARCASRATRSPASTSRSSRACATASTASSPADLDEGIPDEVGDDYDVVLAADVLEHVREPERLLRDARHGCAPGGSVIDERAELRPLVPAGPRRARAASTTTGAASSTAATCASSPGAASSGSAAGRGSRPPRGARRAAVRRRGGGGGQGSLAAPARLARAVGVADPVWLPVHPRGRAFR